MPAGAATLPAGFTEQTMVSGLTRPMDVAWAPDGRMFVIQKDGLLLVVTRRGQPEGTVRVQDFSPIVNGQNDRGLLGLAVDADFAANRYVYLLFTYDIDPPGPGKEVRRGDGVPTASPAGRPGAAQPGDGADRHSRYGDVDGPCPAPTNEVDCIPAEGTTHSVGTVRADPDGTLWVGSGDGYSEEAEFPARAYHEESLAGKIIHVDRDGNGLPGHPFCPGETDLRLVCTKIHARGFRNPFRFTLRPGGGLVVGDVGWRAREELDLIDADGGGNYGWPCREGKLATPDYTDPCSGLPVPGPLIESPGLRLPASWQRVSPSLPAQRTPEPALPDRLPQLDLFRRPLRGLHPPPRAHSGRRFPRRAAPPPGGAGLPSGSARPTETSSRSIRSTSRSRASAR